MGAPDHLPSRRLAELGIQLPTAAVPSFDYVPVTREGHVLYVAGQLPKEDGEVRITGRCGQDVDVDTARRAAVVCTLQGLACAAEAVGGIDHIGGVLRVTGFDTPYPPSKCEEDYLPDLDRVLDAVDRSLAW